MKKIFSKGFAALLPTLLTIFVLYFIIDTFYQYLGHPLGELMKWAALFATGTTQPELMDRSEFWRWFFGMGATIVGVAVGCVLVFAIGSLVATFFGSKILQFTEKRVVSKIPIIRTIYPYAKQFTQFFFKGEQKLEFKAVVAIPFPGPGVYSIAFPVSHGLRHLNEHAKKKMIGVYIPTAPMAFTGFVCFVPREQVIPLPITVEEAMRILISFGVLMPYHQAVSMTEAPDMPIPDTAVRPAPDSPRSGSTSAG